MRIFPAPFKAHIPVAAISTIAAFAVGLNTAVAEQTHQMRIQAAVPSGSMNFEMLEEFASRVERMSEGRLQIRVLSAGAIVPSPQILDSINDGTLEAGFAWPQYWSGKNAATSLFSNTPIWPMAGLDQLSHQTWMSMGGGRELYHELLQDVIGANVVSFSITASGWQPLGWFNEPIEGIEDLASGRYRSPPGLVGEIFNEAGVSTIFISPEELVPAAERGVVTGAGWINPLEDYALGFQDVFSHYYLASVHQFVDVGEILINKDYFDSLPEDLQSMIEVASQSIIMETYMHDISRNADMIQSFQEDYGIEIHATPADINKALLESGQEVLIKHSNENDFFARVVESQTEFAKKLQPWWGETLKSFRQLSDDAIIR